MDKTEEIFRVERFETKTGIRLNSNGERYREGDPDPGILFSDSEEAKRYVRANLRPAQMFYIYDGKGNLIYENVYDEVIIIKKEKWWKFGK